MSIETLTHSTKKPAVTAQHAVALWHYGFNVIPMRLDRKKPALSTWKDLSHRFQRESEITSHDWSGNIGFVNGVNQIRTVDIDECESSDVLMRVLELLGIDAEYEWIVYSPGKGGGYHIHFLCAEDLTLTTSGVCVGSPLATNTFKQIELRWHDCCTMLPPSLHPDANDYYDWLLETPKTPLAKLSLVAVERMFRTVATLQKDNSDQANDQANDFDTQELPEKNLKYDPWAEKAFTQEIAKLHKAVNGSRNAQLNKAAYALGQIVGSGLLNEQDVIAELERAAATIDLPEKETTDTIKSGMEAGKQKPRMPKMVYK
ncbi:MAG TPA: bifunctional DNA primase/polymerase, partial [Nitrososphaera sp.]|nr:bifunctional DNA primase/polymerase [Nitrososphaera sp.]